jgi:hypothetical protein
MSILKQGSNHGCFSQTAMTLFETGMTPFETTILCPTDECKSYTQLVLSRKTFVMTKWAASNLFVLLRNIDIKIC